MLQLQKDATRSAYMPMRSAPRQKCPLPKTEFFTYLDPAAT